MAYQPLGHHGDHDKLPVLDPDQVHDEVGGGVIKTEPPDLEGVHYDLEGSNSCFGVPFTMDDTWTKTPLMEELDSLATTASAASSLGDDDSDSRSAFTLTVAQWRFQGGKLLKVPASSQPATSPPLSLSTKSPTKRCVIENRSDSPVFNDFMGVPAEKRKPAISKSHAATEKAPECSTAQVPIGGSVILNPSVVEPSHFVIKLSEGTSTVSTTGSIVIGDAERNGLVSMSTSQGEVTGGGGSTALDGMMFPCNVCGLCFTDISSLTAHVVNHALCKSCGLVFKDVAGLHYHEQTHHNENAVQNEEAVQVKGEKRAGRKKGEKAGKKSLNEKMPCLASALGCVSSTGSSERLVMKALSLDKVQVAEITPCRAAENRVSKSNAKPKVKKKVAQVKSQKVECPECGVKLKDYKSLGLHTLKLHPTSSTGPLEYTTEADIKMETDKDEFEMKFCIDPLVITSASSVVKTEVEEAAVCDSTSDFDTRQQNEETETQLQGFTCQECGAKFTQDEEHLLKEHQCYIMRCNLCDKPYKNLEKLALHKITEHPGCVECDAIFKNFDSLTLHEELQHFRCAVCGNGCNDHESLSLHKRLEHTKCKWCKKWFACKRSLLNHEDQGPFPCGECDAEFCSLSELVLHEKETHLMCSVCKVVCVSRKELLLHTHHQCKLCSLEYLSAGALLDHQHREHSKCLQCALVFRDRDTLARHVQLQHSNKIKCSVCAEYLPSTLALLAHLKVHIPCRTCATFFKDNEALSKHELEDHGKGVMRSDTRQPSVDSDHTPETELLHCSICSEEYASQEELRAHERLNHEVCRQCYLAFPTKKHLSTHRRTVHKDKRLKVGFSESEESDAMEVEARFAQCTDEVDAYLQCEREVPKFKSQPGKPAVVRVKLPPHSDPSKEQYWVCSVCNKSFPSKKNLNAHHRRVHLDKPYTAATAYFKCSFCGRAFSCRSEFIEHNKDCSKGKRVPCNICGKTFSTSGNLAQHKRIHTSEKPYKCDTCGKTFAQNGTLYRHKTVHTKETPFACQACGKQFGLKGNLVMHLKNIHKIIYKEVSSS